MRLPVAWLVHLFGASPPMPFVAWENLSRGEGEPGVWWINSIFELTQLGENGAGEGGRTKWSEHPSHQHRKWVGCHLFFLVRKLQVVKQFIHSLFLLCFFVMELD